MRRWLARALLSLSTTASTTRAVTQQSSRAFLRVGSIVSVTTTSFSPGPSSGLRCLAVRGGSSSSSTEYTVLSDPAPGSPFHYAFPVRNLAEAKQFYGDVLGCIEGRSSEKWQDYSLHGHQIVAHWAGDDYRCQDYYNPVDGDEVPVPRKFDDRLCSSL